jgi:muconolactone delta-isomerase
MLFSVRLVSRQPHDVPFDTWQGIAGDQLKTIKTHYDQGKVKAIYREVGLGVLAIYDAADAREMDQLIAAMPMARYFVDTTVHALWDMVPAIQGI